MITTKPKFKYIVTLKNKQEAECLADGFDIKNDGAIVFYQWVYSQKNTEGKMQPLSVLAYPHEAWEKCVLLNSDDNAAVETTFSFWGATSLKSSGLPVTQGASQNIHLTQSSTATPNLNKSKPDVIEEELRKYLKENDKFIYASFEKHLQPLSYQFSEEEIQHYVALLIRKNKFPAQKFITPKMKNLMDMHLPPIMRRQWDGVGTIDALREILESKDETRDITKIDLYAWLSLGRYLTS